MQIYNLFVIILKKKNLRFIPFNYFSGTSIFEQGKTF